MTSPSTPRRRDEAVEALRLFAIFGIAVFHTFQPYFDRIAYGVAETDVSGTLAASAGAASAGAAGLMGLGGILAAFVLGIISLLGAAGNSVFFMISGFYLLPRMRSRAADRSAGSAGRYARREAKAFARRAAVILVSIALYALIGGLAQLLGARVFQPARPLRAWLTGGLEFVWLYLLFIALAPLIAWIAARLGRAWPWLVGIFCVCALALDQWIAFADRGSFDRGLLDWRKLMSAATYLGAFLLAGLMGEDHRRTAQAARPLLVASLVLILIGEGTAAAFAGRGRMFLLGALSYKSTSLLSFLFACALLACACSRSLACPAETVDRPEPRRAHWVRRLASSILGFYIAQSLLFLPWHAFCIGPLEALRRAACPAAFILVGIVAALLYALVLMAIDLLLRPRVLRLLRLAR